MEQGEFDKKDEMLEKLYRALSVYFEEGLVPSLREHFTSLLITKLLNMSGNVAKLQQKRIN